MVIDDLHATGVSILPNETQTVAVVDPDAVLPRAAGFQGFQKVSWRAEIVETSSRVKLEQFAANARDHRPSRRWVLVGNPLGAPLSGGGEADSQSAAGFQSHPAEQHSRSQMRGGQPIQIGRAKPARKPAAG